jgi:hypothetical protein
MSAEEPKNNPGQDDLWRGSIDLSQRFLDEVLIPRIGEGTLTGKDEIISLYQTFQQTYRGQQGSDFTLHDVCRVAFARDLMFTNTQETIEVLEGVDYAVFEAMAYEITTAERLLWEITKDAKSRSENND